MKSKTLLKLPKYISKEIKEIRRAFKKIELLKAGKLKSHPVKELLRKL